MAFLKRDRTMAGLIEMSDKVLRRNLTADAPVLVAIPTDKKYNYVIFNFSVFAPEVKFSELPASLAGDSDDAGEYGPVLRQIPNGVTAIGLRAAGDTTVWLSFYE